MRRKKSLPNDLQLEFCFQEDDAQSELNTSAYEKENRRYDNSLPRLSENQELDTYQQIEIFLSQVGDVLKRRGLSLGSFILRSFYVEGKNVSEISELLSAGVDGIPSVTRERVRTMVFEIREELLAVVPSKYTKGIRFRKDFVERLSLFTADQIGYVVKDQWMLDSPRLEAIAFLLHKKVIEGDTTIPWIRSQKLILDEKIEKRVFNMYYASLFYLLQKEVRPVSYENILAAIPVQKQWKGDEVNEELLSFLLQHDEVFEKKEDDTYQLRAEHLNVTQRIARIIFEEKDITPAEIQRIYEDRFGSKFASLTVVGKIYPWCVPIGKSKWVCREDCKRQRQPAEIIHEYCQEHVRFTMDDVIRYLQSQGVDIKQSSIRCYILRDCRRLNSDGNVFCLTSEISQEEDHLWFSKMNVVNRTSGKKEWNDTLKNEIRSLLDAAPEHRMLQKDVKNACKYIFDKEGIAYNNFYKVVNSLFWLKITEVDGQRYLELD